MSVGDKANHVQKDIEEIKDKLQIKPPKPHCMVADWCDWVWKYLTDAEALKLTGLLDVAVTYSYFSKEGQALTHELRKIEYLGEDRATADSPIHWPLELQREEKAWREWVHYRQTHPEPAPVQYSEDELAQLRKVKQLYKSTSGGST